MGLVAWWILVNENLAFVFKFVVWECSFFLDRRLGMQVVLETNEKLIFHGFDISLMKG